MFGRRISKNHPRVEAYGTVDELSAALGLARALLEEGWLQGEIRKTQVELIGLMGALAVDEADGARYAEAGYAKLEPEALARLDQVVAELEQKLPKPTGWALAGETVSAGALEVARTVCRRAERRLVALQEGGAQGLDLPLAYLNRLADFLWLAARWAEKKSEKKTG
jgi:cob(I)alamin adenosyltransferase